MREDRLFPQLQEALSSLTHLFHQKAKGTKKATLSGSFNACVKHVDPELSACRDLSEKRVIKEVKTCQMESVRLKINEHMTSVGEEILCVLDKQQRGADVCCVKLVRVFVLERLSSAAEFMCNLFHREIEKLETLLEKQNKLLEIDFDMDIDLHTASKSVTHTHQTTQCRYVCYTTYYTLQ